MKRIVYLDGKQEDPRVQDLDSVRGTLECEETLPEIPARLV